MVSVGVRVEPTVRLGREAESVVSTNIFYCIEILFFGMRMTTA